MLVDNVLKPERIKIWTKDGYIQLFQLATIYFQCASGLLEQRKRKEVKKFKRGKRGRNEGRGKLNVKVRNLVTREGDVREERKAS